MKDILLTRQKEIRILCTSLQLSNTMSAKSRFRIWSVSLLFIGWLLIHLFQADGETNKTTIYNIKNDVMNANVEPELVASNGSKSVVEKNTASAFDKAESTATIGVIELRNYVIKHGLRDTFIHYFEENFIKPQEALQGFLLGQYRVKGAEDNFCWIRGFKDMGERSKFLPAFYYGPVWKQHKQVANAMLANNDNVYLLKPLLLRNDSLEVATSMDPFRLMPTNGIAVVDFYIANTKLDQLLRLFAKEYLPWLKENGISDFTLWTSVLEENDFPRLPVFQDKNLLVTITFYKNELTYEEEMKKVTSKMRDDLKANLQDVITIQHTMILYPTEKTTHKKP